MLDVPSMEGLGLIVEEEGISLAATRHNAARRERQLAPDRTCSPGAAVLRRADDEAQRCNAAAPALGVRRFVELVRLTPTWICEACWVDQFC